MILLKTQIVGLITILTSFLAHGADLPRFTFKVRIPAAASDCSLHAQELAALISQSSKDIQNVQGRCIVRGNFSENGENFSIDSLAVDYSAPSNILPYTAQLDTQDIFAGPLYPTFRSCLDDLNFQKSLFAQATELTPIVATCLPHQDSSWGYNLMIQGLGGQWKKHLLQFKNIAHVKAQTDVAWSEQIQSTIKAAGGLFAKRNGEVFFYYSNYASLVNTTSLFTTSRLTECESQRGEALSMLAKLGAKSSNVQCHKWGELGASLDLVADVGSFGFESAQIDGQNYFSFDECMGARADLKTRNETNNYLYAIFCMPGISSSSFYQIHSFSR